MKKPITKRGFSITESLILLIIIIAIVIGLGRMFMQPVMESRTYNKLTGAKTTWWDAVWVELRVAEGTKINSND